MDDKSVREMLEVERLRGWVPIEDAPQIDYKSCLLAVTCEHGLTIRIGMWDPEMPGWMIFGAKWGPLPMFHMELPALPEAQPQIAWHKEGVSVEAMLDHLRGKK